jgi:hypothetical protein
MPHRTVLTLVALMPLAGCSSHAYYDEAKIYVSETQRALVDAQFCENIARCSINDVVKFEAGGWGLGPLTYGGVYINVYEVQDPAVANQDHYALT